MPWLHSVHFGRLEYAPSSTLVFSEGLPGFETERSFLLVEQPCHHPLVFVQSVKTPELCFPALPVRVVAPEYIPRLSPADLQSLGFREQPRIGEDAVVLTLVAVHEQNPTANLFAPIVINLRTRASAQCIDGEMRYSHRQPLLPVQEAAS